ncbi:MAG: hypothetical protein ACRDD4_12415 [Culicoidibacterales bacterium]
MGMFSTAIGIRLAKKIDEQEEKNKQKKERKANKKSTVINELNISNTQTNLTRDLMNFMTEKKATTICNIVIENMKQDGIDMNTYMSTVRKSIFIIVNKQPQSINGNSPLLRGTNLVFTDTKIENNVEILHNKLASELSVTEYMQLYNLMKKNLEE